MVNNNALVLLSGGQDSSTCLFWSIQNFENVRAVGFNYGQRHHRELEAASQIAQSAQIPFQIFSIDTLANVSKNALTNSEIEIEFSKVKDMPPNTLVEGRNLLFLTYAAVYAKQLKTDNLVMGVGQTDYSGYPDCRYEFIQAANNTINLALDHEFIVHTPLMWKNKMQIWEMADKLGIFDLVCEYTVTCYNGLPGKGCGSCPSCILRNKGLEEYLKTKNDRSR